MNKLHRVAGMALTLVLAIGAYADETAVGSDPAVDVAAQIEPPAFREVLKGKAWEHSFQDALVALGDLDRLARSQWPVAALLVAIDPAPDSPAIAAGLLMDTQIAEVDGHYLNEAAYGAVTPQQEHEFTVVGADGVRKKVVVLPGQLGIDVLDVVHPELLYLRSGKRGAAWDRYAAVGAAACFSKPAVSETAWHHAIAAGYTPDAISDYCGLQAAWRQGRNDEALAFLAKLRARPGIPAELGLDALDRQLSIANFKIERAVKADVTLPSRRYNATDPAPWLAKLIDAHHNLPPAERSLPSPSELAAGKKTSLLKSMEPKLQGNENWDRYRREQSAKIAAQRDPVKVSAMTSHYEAFVQLPTVNAPDVEVVARGKMRATDTGRSGFVTRMFVGLVNGDDPESTKISGFPAKGGMVSVEIQPHGLCLINMHGRDKFLVQAVDVQEEIKDGREFTLRLLHVGGREEVWINQRRLLYLPAGERPERAGFFLGTVGTTFDLHIDYNAVEVPSPKK